MKFLTIILGFGISIGMMACDKNNNSSAIQKDTYTDTLVNNNQETKSDIVIPEDNTTVREDSSGKSIYYEGN